MARHVTHTASGSTGRAASQPSTGRGGGGGGASSWVAEHERITGTTLTPTSQAGVYTSSDGSVVQAPGYEGVVVSESTYPTLSQSNGSTAAGSGWLPNYAYGEFLTPEFVDPIEVARQVGEYNATQVPIAASEAEQITRRFNESNIGMFLSNRETILPGVGQAQQDSLQLGQDLTNFNLPQGFVNLLRRESASSAFRRGGGAGQFSENRFFSTLGTAGLNAAVQGASLTDQLNARASSTAQALMPDIQQEYARSLGLRTITPATGIAAEQFNSNLDFSTDQLFASDSRFRAESYAQQRRDFFQARVNAIARDAEASASGGGSLGGILTVAGAIIGGIATGGNPAGIMAGASIGGAIGGSSGGSAQQTGQAIGGVWPESPDAPDNVPAPATTVGGGGVSDTSGGPVVATPGSVGTGVVGASEAPTATGAVSSSSSSTAQGTSDAPITIGQLESQRFISDTETDFDEDIQTELRLVRSTTWSPRKHGNGFTNPSGRNSGEILI